MRRSPSTLPGPQVTRRLCRAALLWLAAWCASASSPGSTVAQTLSGRLLDVETGLPVPYGLVMMFTESGDSVTSAISTETGHFRLSSPTAGSFVLRAVALGYRETPAGVFELGVDGSITIEYGLPPQPLPIDAIVVSLDRPVIMHQLVRNGFVRRLQRGLGVFITPHEIEESSATSTEQLMEGISGLRVGNAHSRPLPNVLLPRPDIGETIQVQRLGGGWCAPTIYLDGKRFYYDPEMGFTLSTVAQLQSVEAIEIYRRPAEIPVEYSTEATSNCGVLVVWTKTGPGAGQGAGVAIAAGGSDRLPSADGEGPPPEPGESIRMELAPEARRTLALTSPWQGTFLMVRGEELVARDTVLGRAVVVPIGDIRALQVSRQRAPRHALMRGVMAGAAVGAAVWGGLSVLCGWSQCNGAVERPWLPATAAGLFVGFVVQARGPGHHWLRTTVPARALPRRDAWSAAPRRGAGGR